MDVERCGATVALLSSDSALTAMCREICAEITPERVAVVTGTVDAAPVGADHYIWDVSPGAALPEDLIRSSPERHLILIERRHLAWLGERRLEETMIVLKPVTRPNLTAFLTHALAPRPQRWSDSPRQDRYALLESLLQATIRLQEYDQERTTFLACAAHEFRVPLTAISGYCGLLLDGSAGDMSAMQREIVGRLSKSARRLGRLAAGMHALSLGQRAPAPQLERQEMDDPIQQAIHECRPFLEDRNLEVDAEVVPATGQLWFERGQIDQVLVNLIENACGHSPQRGRIRVRAYPWFWERRRRNDSIAGPDRRADLSRQPNAYRVDVFDSGAPVAEEDLARIFDEFVSLRRDNARPGSGLGLAICRNIVVRHYGVIWAEPCAGGKQFSFALPYRPAAPPAVGSMQAEACQAKFSSEINTL